MLDAEISRIVTKIGTFPVSEFHPRDTNGIRRCPDASYTGKPLRLGCQGWQGNKRIDGQWAWIDHERQRAFIEYDVFAQHDGVAWSKKREQREFSFEIKKENNPKVWNEFLTFWKIVEVE